MPPVLPQPYPSVPPVTCVGAQLPQPARVPSVSSSSTQHCGSCLWELEKTFSTHFFACVHLVQQPLLHLGWAHCTSTWLWPTVITTNIISQTVLDLLLCSVSRYLWGQSDSDSWLTSTSILFSEAIWPLKPHCCHCNFTMQNTALYVTYTYCTYFLGITLKLLIEGWLCTNFLTGLPSEKSAGGGIPIAFSGIFWDISVNFTFLFV